MYLICYRLNPRLIKKQKLFSRERLLQRVLGRLGEYKKGNVHIKKMSVLFRVSLELLKKSIKKTKKNNKVY